MTVKIKNSGSYISKINGKQLINNQYALDINSDRKKSKQVLGMFNNNGHIERMHDSLQNYMNKMSSKNQSIFDLLRNERSEVNKIPNIAIKILDNPPQSIMSSPKKMKQNTKKLAITSNHNGISSKLFDFTNIGPDSGLGPQLGPGPSPRPQPSPRPRPRRAKQSRKKRRKRVTHKNGKRL
jgi:hypothetical protein